MVDHPAMPSMSDPPFACPVDDPVIGGIILDLPPPPSVNRTHRIDWKGKAQLTAFANVADAYVLAAKGRSVQPLQLRKISCFELHILVSERHTKIDLDNGLKALIDYLKRIELIEDDGPKHMRRLTVEWGNAPHGSRVTIRPLPRTMREVLQRSEARK